MKTTTVIISTKEMREKIFEENNDPSTLKSFKNDINNKITAASEEFNDLYNSTKLERAAQSAIKMRYLQKLSQDIRSLIKAKKQK